MARTRNSKRRATEAGAGDDGAAPADAVRSAGTNNDTLTSAPPAAAADQTDPAEAALAQASKVRSRKAKQRRIDAQQRKPRFEVLCEQSLMPGVVAMFDSPRDLFSLAFTSKTCQSFITREDVVRSSVFQGGNARKIIGDIMKRIEKKSIYLPSAIRLLRLVNGRICENLDDCWGYDLRREKNTNLATVHHAFRPYGLLLCKDCCKGMSTSVPWSHYATDVARVDTRTLDMPFFDSLGERNGPVVLTKHLRQIERSYKDTQERKNALNKILEEADEEADDDQDSIINTLVETHKDAESKAAAFIKSRQDLEHSRAVEASKERSSKKIARMKEIYAQLEALLDGYDHKELALQCTWDETYGYVHFQTTLSEEVLEKLFGASSSASKKKITAAAQELRRVYDVADSKKLLAPDFLSFLSDRSDNMERALFEQCEAMEMTPARLLGCYLVTLEWLESATHESLVGLVMESMTSNERGSAFARTVVPASDENQENLRMLAQSAFVQVFPGSSWDPTTRMHRTMVERLRIALPDARTKYFQIRDGLSEYLALPHVVGFAENASPPPNNPDQTITRLDVVNTIYKDSTGQSYLDRRNFGALFLRHEDMFQNPSFYPRIFGDLDG